MGDNHKIDHTQRKKKKSIISLKATVTIQCLPEEDIEAKGLIQITKHVSVYIKGNKVFGRHIPVPVLSMVSM